MEKPESGRSSFSNWPLAEDPAHLADAGGWSEEVYCDFLALQSGDMTKNEFRKKYLRTCAILNLDMTGFTIGTIKEGQIDTLLRIFDIQKIAVPVLEENGALLVKAFADDLVALYDNAHQAFSAAMEIHKRVSQFNENNDHHVTTECCIGIGYGEVYAIGPNLAQGIEMNLASKLGEDIARGGETLVTDQARAALTKLDGVTFQRQLHDELSVEFFKAICE